MGTQTYDTKCGVASLFLRKSRKCAAKNLHIRNHEVRFHTQNYELDSVGRIMIKKLPMLLACAAMLSMMAGCANRPVRDFFRGAFCNTCQPPVGQPLGCGTNYAPACDTGACGAGVVGQPAIQANVGQPVFQDSTGVYSENPAVIQPNINVPVQADPFGMPESSQVYGGTPGGPAIGPVQGSGSRN